MPGTLSKLVQRAQRRTSKLRVLCQEFEAAKNFSQKDVLATFIAIENANLWDAFARTLYLTCAMDGPATSKGLAITHAHSPFADDRDALLFAIDAVNKTHAAKLRASGQKIRSRDEPAWQDRNVLLRIVRALGLSNEPSISAAISASVTTLANLPTIRNFYAHRCEDTALKTAAVQLGYGFASSIHPTQFLASRLAARPYTILRHLVDDIGISTAIACS